MKKEFLDLGRHPIANAFLDEKDFENEFFFDLKVCWDENTKLVSIKEFVEPERIFNEDYPYNTSNSFPMIQHFKNTAMSLKKDFNPNSVLEIGSNSGAFIENFPKDNSYCVEPCDNFAEVTGNVGYKTWTDFWTTELSNRIKNSVGKMDLIYAANCICHIHNLDDTFRAVKNLLSEDGVFVFEDPSLRRILERGSYDQIYDEHPHIFSVTALKNILERNNLQIFNVDNLSVHGGSNRIYVSHKDTFPQNSSVEYNLTEEHIFGVNTFQTYEIFADRVATSKKKLIDLLSDLKGDGNKIMSIGATAKSTTVFNYCGIDTDLIDIISDTTLDKQGKFSPGVHIPIVSRDEIDILNYNYVYLGAWNFKDVIAEREKGFVENGGKFITHVPDVMVFS